MELSKQLDSIILLEKIIKNPGLIIYHSEELNELVGSIVHGCEFGKMVFYQESYIHGYNTDYLLTKARSYNTDYLLTKILCLFGTYIADDNKLEIMNLLLNTGVRTNSKRLGERYKLIPAVLFSNYEFYRKHYDYSWSLIVNGLNKNINKTFNNLSYQFGVNLNKYFLNVFNDEKYYLFYIALQNITTKKSALKIFSKHYLCFNYRIRNVILEDLILDYSITNNYFIGLKQDSGSFDPKLIELLNEKRPTTETTNLNNNRS